jgi:uncharacterized repeat protein (TIGR03843 family)
VTKPVDEADGEALGVTRVMALLADGDLTLRGQVPWSSNATFLATVSDGDLRASAIYKPQRGETPLWDFAPGTLCLREMAAFVVSQALGWQLVPPTVLRDGPYGRGAVQVFIPHDPQRHYLELEAPDAAVARRIAAFDVIVNNADRKAGHVLLADDGALWAIDHGVCFSAEPKLRTVIWEFAGQVLPPDMVNDLVALADDLADTRGELRAALAPLLAGDEVDALLARTRDLVAAGVFPTPDPQRRSIPWPPV